VRLFLARWRGRWQIRHLIAAGFLYGLADGLAGEDAEVLRVATDLRRRSR
jgi:hypothetical protein